MITLHDAFPQYVSLRRALGTKLQEPARTLVDFVNFMEREKAAFITTELALRWAMKPQGVQRATWGRRLSMVRKFAAWLSTIDSRTEVPPDGAASSPLPPASGPPSAHCSRGMQQPSSPRCSVRLVRAELRAPVPVLRSQTSRRNTGKRIRRESECSYAIAFGSATASADIDANELHKAIAIRHAQTDRGSPQ